MRGRRTRRGFFSPSYSALENNLPVLQSYAQDPALRPVYYNPTAAAGSRFDTSASASTIPRMYHSTATLLADGSVFVAGSNPNVDVIE